MRYRPHTGKPPFSHGIHFSEALTRMVDAQGRGSRQRRGAFGLGPWRPTDIDRQGAPE